MHHQYRLSVFQWNPCPARRNPTKNIAAVCGRFRAVILQEASDHVTHISDQFIAYTGNTDLAILLNKDTFEPDPAVFAFNEASTSKYTSGMVLLIVRGLLRRPSLSGTPTVTFCSDDIHNVVAKKRDAATDLLRRLHGYMQPHNVDFTGGDYYMSAFSTVGDVFGPRIFSTRQFVPVETRCAGGAESRAHWVSHHAKASILSGVCIHTAPKNTITLRSASDLVINPLTSLCSYISVPPTCLAPTASCAANMHNKEWNGGITNMNVCGDDDHDRAPVCQGHVSVSPFTPFAVAREPFASQLCLLPELTQGRFASSLCLCLFVFNSLNSNPPSPNK